MSEQLQSEMLSRFLKARRAALSPDEFGLRSDCRRRTPGLRREELASLIGVSVSWYTWLEQGRNISVSTSVLERLAGVLQLDPAQREYLFSLVQKRPAPLVAAEPTDQYEAGALVWRTLDALAMPALAMTYRWDVVAWNRYIQLFRDYSQLPPRERNLLRLLVGDPVHKRNPEDYEAKIRLATSRLRFDYTQVGEDPILDDLIRELCEACPIFRQHWEDSCEIGPAQSVSTVIHREFGRFNFEHCVYVPKGEPHLRVVVYFPHDEAAAEALERLAGHCDGERLEVLPAAADENRRIA